MLIQEDIETEKLFDAIYQSLEKMLAEFGFVSYKKKWEAGNFPIYEYITLRQLQNGFATCELPRARRVETKDRS